MVKVAGPETKPVRGKNIGKHWVSVTFDSAFTVTSFFVPAWLTVSVQVPPSSLTFGTLAITSMPLASAVASKTTTSTLSRSGELVGSSVGIGESLGCAVVGLSVGLRASQFGIKKSQPAKGRVAQIITAAEMILNFIQRSSLIRKSRINAFQRLIQE